jgi:hypothetical protein
MKNYLQSNAEILYIENTTSPDNDKKMKKIVLNAEGAKKYKKPIYKILK